MKHIFRCSLPIHWPIYQVIQTGVSYGRHWNVIKMIQFIYSCLSKLNFDNSVMQTDLYDQ